MILPRLSAAADTKTPVVIVAPRGSGAIRLARRLPTLLGPLSENACASIGAVYDCARIPGCYNAPLRPFRAPHHTVGAAGLSGRLGEVDLARHGVLVLDDLPEFRSMVLVDLAHRLRDWTDTTGSLPWVVGVASSVEDGQELGHVMRRTTKAAEILGAVVVHATPTEIAETIAEFERETP